jgi:NADP-dependent 3-hydroxy acid dehydrogenase YdfG
MQSAASGFAQALASKLAEEGINVAVSAVQSALSSGTFS